MKKLFILGIISFFAVATSAQEIFQKGTNVVNLGIGVGSHIPIQASFEHSIIDGLIKGENGAIGVGGYTGWYSYSDSYTEGKVSYSNFVLGVRGAFHYQFVDKLDTYAGVMLGYDIVSSKWKGSGAFDGSVSSSEISTSAFVGARYYFTPSIAAYSELGYGISYLSLGVALKF
ncbi:MAG: hypothetical protein LBD89_00320 [Tannerellaceae bacterium]|jgi:hypothetical protein|nr:hypothetical protein [Tannerellaceae bacterium]